MKRSQINQEILAAINEFEERGFNLPPWAHYTPETWRQILTSPRKGYREVTEKGLGWDVIDFGSGDFERTGLLLFTLRNGTEGTNRNYAEKVMRVNFNQVTPWHFHWKKAEDIINRGGGNLAVRLYNAHPRDTLQPGEKFQPGIFDRETEVNYLLDGGVWKSISPGGKVTLQPGQSITLTPRVYHTFYGHSERDPVIVGEVSSVNSDIGDNRFHENLPRFPPIEEDAPARFVLCNEYKALRHKTSK